MYAISFLGALLTGLLVLNYWGVDPDRIVVESRETPLLTITREDQTDG